jgi:hypothetical protein
MSLAWDGPYFSGASIEGLISGGATDNLHID